MFCTEILKLKNVPLLLYTGLLKSSSLNGMLIKPLCSFSCRILSWLHPVHKCVSSAEDFFFPGQQSVSGGLPLSLATPIHLQAQQQSSQTDLWLPVGILQQHSQEKSGSNSFSVSVACLRNICQPRLKVSRTEKNY